MNNFRRIIQDELTNLINLSVSLLVVNVNAGSGQTSVTLYNNGDILKDYNVNIISINYNNSDEFCTNVLYDYSTGQIVVDYSINYDEKNSRSCTITIEYKDNRISFEIYQNYNTYYNYTASYTIDDVIWNKDNIDPGRVTYNSQGFYHNGKLVLLFDYDLGHVEIYYHETNTYYYYSGKEETITGQTQQRYVIRNTSQMKTLEMSFDSNGNISAPLDLNVGSTYDKFGILFETRFTADKTGNYNGNYSIEIIKATLNAYNGDILNYSIIPSEIYPPIINGTF